MTIRERAEMIERNLPEAREMRVRYLELELKDLADTITRDAVERCAIEIQKWASGWSSYTIDELIAAIRQSGAKDE